MRKFPAAVLISILALCLAIVSVLRLSTGEWQIPLKDVIHFMAVNLPEREKSSPQALVIRSVRVPRLLCSIGTGGLLSVSGTVMQGVLANPMAEPYTLGVAAGAAFGAAVGILAPQGNLTVMPCAFIGALSALALAGLTSARSSENSKIILAGIVANSILSAGVTVLKAVSGERLGAIVLWLMGSFSGSGSRDALAIWASALTVTGLSWVFGPVLDVMSMGDDRGYILGINERTVRSVLLMVCSLGVAVAVSSFGVIGFVGLLTPHLIRLSVGPTHRNLILTSFLAGGFLLSLADWAAQMLGELPVGAITALIGGPFLYALLRH